MIRAAYQDQSEAEYAYGKQQERTVEAKQSFKIHMNVKIAGQKYPGKIHQKKIGKDSKNTYNNQYSTWIIFIIFFYNLNP